MQIRRDRLRVIDRGLGADDAQPDGRRIHARRGEQAARGGGGERHGIFVLARDRHARYAEPLDVLAGGHAARGGEVGEIEVSLGHCERDGVDSDRRHEPSVSGSAMSNRGATSSIAKSRGFPAGGAVWSAPTIDLKRRAIYVGSGNAYTVPAAETSDSVVAFDMDSGKLLRASAET